MCSGHGVEIERPSDDYDREWPEEKTDDTSWLTIIYRRWTYCYMNRVLQKGSRQMLADGTHLSDDDLYKAPHSMEASHLLSKFRKYSEEERARHRKHPFLRTLWDLAAPTFVPAGFCQLITVFAQVAIPVLVRQLLSIIEEHPGENVIKKGMPYAILIFVASVVNAFGNHRHKHLAMKTGVVLRAGLVSVIYDNALHLTPAGRSGLTSGEITTLVAVDTQKLFEVTQEAHLIWSCPLSMLFVTILLLVIMGPTTIVGMAFLVLFVPLVQFIAARMLAIRRKRVELTDKRVEMVNAMLQGIKVTKLNNYEKKYQARIEQVRKQEVKLLRKELFYWAMTLVVTVLSPVIASSTTFVTYVLVSEDNILTASMTFTVLLLFAALRFPINYTGRLIGRAAQAMDAARRIAHFLDRATRFDYANDDAEEETTAEDDTDGRAAVTLKVEGATFSVGTGSDAVSDCDTDTESSCRSIGTDSRRRKAGFAIRNVNLSLSPGKILAVVGPVASGKSTLINGIIGEATVSPDSVISKRGNVAYVAQIPFILNATLRYNITFGLPYEKDRFDAVIEACCLKEDIDQLGDAGDLVEIGERGVTLSGGQKQRVSLARAVYAQPSILLCDDPLSALDASTGKKIFDQLFDSKKNTLLSSTAIVLVTHAAHFLNRVDEILVVVDGSVTFTGTWNQLLEYKSDDVKHMAAIEFIRSSVQESGEEDSAKGEGESMPKENVDKASQSSRSETAQTDGKKGKDGKLMTVETREHGHSSLKTWLLWFRYAGGIPFLLIQVSLMAFDRLSYVGTEVWLSLWTQGADQPVYALGREFPPQTDGRSAQYQYLLVFAIILLASFTSTFLRSQWAVTGGTRCARTVFDGMLASVLRAPVGYFESVPLGRVLSRFTYDTEYVDINLSQSMSTLMISVSWWVAGITIMVILLPWMALALLVTTIIYGILMVYFRKSGPDLQRLDAVSRSPIQAMLAEGLDGASTIRVFHREQVFLKIFQRATDTNSSAMLNYVTAQRYLALRIELLGSMIVLISSTLVVALNETLQLEAGFAALLIIWSSNYTITLQFLVDTFNEAEAAITSIERVHAMCDLPKEKSMQTDESVKLPDTWPSDGLVEFQDVQLRYRDGLPLALDGLSFHASPGERIGIVGRSGAGKSSITVALFRLVEIVGGKIFVDGIDLSTLGLSDVRGRLRIIPQDPFLLSGTLRDCLDPFGGSTDDEILEALKAVRLVSDDADSTALESRVEEGGSNFSVGERQLLCLARALLAKPRVLVLDEATSSVDYETDAFIQNLLRTRFNDTTLMTIAHRLNTIMDYDKILVMDNGRASEFGSPKELLEREKSTFRDLVASTGEESAKTLREIAFTK